MATIVRVKRKRNVEAAQGIVVSCKKAKSDVANNEANDENDFQSCLKFAGTVTSKVVYTQQKLRSKFIQGPIY